MKTKNLFRSLLVCACAVTMMSSCCSWTNVVGISSNSLVGDKVGTSTQVTIMGVFGVGGPRQSVQAAAKDGGITKISHVEEHNKNVFMGLVSVHTIRVYGE